MNICSFSDETFLVGVEGGLREQSLFMFRRPHPMDTVWEMPYWNNCKFLYSINLHSIR